MTNRNKLSETCRKALDRAARDGGVVLVGSSLHAGRVERTALGTLRKLQALGYVQLSDDASSARLTEAGRSVARSYL